jgi:hypothetical protein
MLKYFGKSKAARIAIVIAPFALGCDQLLDPQQPDVISPDQISAAGAPGAQALYVGAIDAFKDWTGGGGNQNNQNIWMYSDLVTDVWKTSDTFNQRIDMDRRNIQNNDAEVTGRYATVQQARGHFRNAMGPLRTYVPTEPEKEAEMYFALGFTEMNMAEVFCNGIPLGETVAGVVTYGPPLTNQAVYDIAITHLDSAIALAAGTGAAAVRVRQAAEIAKSRTLVNKAQWTAAASAALAAIPTNYQYTFTFAQTSQDNTIWTTTNNPGNSRYSVGDSVTLSQGVETRILNAIPFGSANDPRVPYVGSWNVTTTVGFDGSTPYVGQRVWPLRNNPVVVVSGIDARLIEAEARLRANDIPGMMTILNGIRTTSRTLGALVVPAMAALPTPGTQTAAEDLFFREKAFWQFGRGTRMGDLRRLIRQYGRTEATTFPEGGFHKTPFTFGNDINLPVPDSEKTNTLFNGCIDRDA